MAETREVTESEPTGARQRAIEAYESARERTADTLGEAPLLALAGGLALWFMSRGKALLSPRQLAPDQTVTTLKEDKEWLKQRLTSGATSS